MSGENFIKTEYALTTLLLYTDEDEIISAENMLPAVEVEFENTNVNHNYHNGGITNMDVDEETVAGKNIIHNIYKI